MDTFVTALYVKIDDELATIRRLRTLATGGRASPRS